ncbi:hypothetical protein [Haloarcula laminariae]|uniref:hypothetical protein n=1 Tax=Haloarcula laminariae TaxID=2961577 RepID=UPI0021C96FC0|nr:hypothetical protein [Halomicroarcula laminariae]
MEGNSGHGNHGTSHEAPQGHSPGEHTIPGGLALDANGLRFDPSETRFEAGTAIEWTFSIVNNDGEPVTDFDYAHGQRSHLIIVRRDLTRFQHLHPKLDSDGTWHVENFPLPDPGVYRAFVDIVVDGQPATLGFDLFASGSGTIDARPSSSLQATADGYEVELITDGTTPGEASQLQFEVCQDEAPVANLDEYLGARGHLVAIREGDLAYLHVHPKETDPDSGVIQFIARFPTVGRYRLFLQAKPNGTLITTSFDIHLENKTTP